MTSDDLRRLQAPLKSNYKSDPESAVVEISIRGAIDADDIRCRVASPRGAIVAGLHPAAGGDGSLACSADMLLESLVACAGVTLKAVATALDIPLDSAAVAASARLDFRGTLGVSKEAPVGLRSVRLEFDIQSSAPPEQIQKLIELTERYCVIYQTLKTPPDVKTTRRDA